MNKGKGRGKKYLSFGVHRKYYYIQTTDTKSLFSVNSRNDKVKIIDKFKLKIGKNFIVNRLNCLNNLIDYDWLNLSFNSFKIRCKEKLLT